MKRPSVPPAWRYVVVGLAVAAAAAFSIVDMASAHAGSGPAERHGSAGFGPAGMGLPFVGPGLDRVLDTLQATEAQRDQLHRIAEGLQADLKPVAEAARSERGKMMELFAQPTVDAAAVEALRKQILARQDQMSKRVNVAMLEAAKVLTAEQRQQMAELMKQRAERHAEHHAHGADGAAGDGPVH